MLLSNRLSNSFNFLAISSGERIKSIHPLDIALLGMSGCAAEEGGYKRQVPRLNHLHKR